APVANQLLQLRQLGTLRSIGDRLPIRPARGGEASAEIRESLVGDVDAEGPERAVLWRGRGRGPRRRGHACGCGEHQRAGANPLSAPGVWLFSRLHRSTPRDGRLARRVPPPRDALIGRKSRTLAPRSRRFPRKRRACPRRKERPSLDPAPAIAVTPGGACRLLLLRAGRTPCRHASRRSADATFTR